jgi:hypothetical protein
MRPIVPEDIANGAAERRSLQRAITSIVLGSLRRTDPTRILNGAWPTDRQAAMALQALTTRAASGPPLATTAAPSLQVEAQRVLALLAPASAALELFSYCLRLNLGSNATVRLPNVAMVPAAVFIAENAPGPVVQYALGSAVLGPLRKLLAFAVTTTELEVGSVESASAVIGRLLAASVAKGIDAVAFASAAADSARPAGLFNGVTPIAPAPGGAAPLENVAADLAAMAAAIAAAGIDPAGMVVVASTKQATTLRLLAGPQFDNPLISTPVLPDRTIAAFAPGAIGVAFEGPPDISVGREVSLHFEDTAPAQIGTVGTPNVVAAPTRSAFQQDLLVIRCRMWAAWAVAMAGSVQLINLVNW